MHADGVDLQDPLVNKNLGQVLDIDYLRSELPSLTEFKLKPAMIFKLVKDMIGKDLSKISLPVFINEPFSILQKAGEFQYYSSFGLAKAARCDDPLMRLVHVAVN